VRRGSHGICSSSGRAIRAFCPRSTTANQRRAFGSPPGFSPKAASNPLRLPVSIKHTDVVWMINSLLIQMASAPYFSLILLIASKASDLCPLLNPAICSWIALLPSLEALFSWRVSAESSSLVEPFGLLPSLDDGSPEA
jgi:hypothetical protein